MDKKKSATPSRREFLKTAGLGVGVAAVAGGIVSVDDAEAATLQDEKTTGYRETEHVKKYYDSARM
jgi:hypothetical protein|tara:strand:+ start:15475 stop:15672 length:198 start_codon:yes stop_codon:yes gene_type:complete